MAVTAKYTEFMQFVHTPAAHARVKAIADAEGVSKAKVIRDIFDAGIDARVARSPARMLDRGGDLPAGQTRVLEGGQPEVVLRRGEGVITRGGDHPDRYLDHGNGSLGTSEQP